MGKRGLKISGSILIIGGILCMGYPFFKMKLEKAKAEENLLVLNEKLEEKKEEKNRKEESKIDKDSYVEVNGERIIGKIIVKEGLEVPILKGATDKTLEDGAGLYDNGVSIDDNKGNAVILGHREVTFRFIEDIQIGDILKVQTINGVYEYEVTKTYITKPEDMSILEQSEESTLTLVTCYPFRYIGPAPERFIAKLVKINMNKN
ncbi:MAG: class D sortase [Clostridium sp.]|uniref:class D sortase n=1 Tax=Clostridium sp. TaxID=1506 RepID=UPI003F325F5B